jgi:iron complex outermembrane receptor protein
MTRRREGRQARPGVGLLLVAALVFAPSARGADGAPAVEQPSPTEADAESQASADPVENIVVRAQRVPERALSVPAAVSVVDRESIQLARQQLTLGESLVAVPGVFTQNRQNFAQDLRISIRGFGARARFGIRGIRVILDGIPTTLPDGQGQIDTIQLPTAGRIEVLRGPSASLYGSAAGGVIRIETEPVPAVPRVEARALGGRYGYQQYDAKAMGPAGPVGLLVGLSRQVKAGYRDQSRVESNLLNARMRWEPDAASELTAYTHFLYGPIADDPGGLSAAQVARDPRQSQTCNAILDAGERVNQVGGGVRYRRAFGDRNETTAVGWAGWRDFSNRLAFGNACLGGGPGGSAGTLDRVFGGANLQHVYSGDLLSLPNRLMAGVQVEFQRDARDARELFPTMLGATTLDQDEDVTGLRFYVQDDWTLPADLEVGASVGFDALRYEVDDLLPPTAGDVDDSGRLDFDAWSPAATLRWSPREALNLYGRVSTSFEPPTTTELRRLDGGGGFDPTLEPQRAVNYEVGAKGLLPGRLRYELAVYYVETEDEILRIQIAGDDRFRNAGRTGRVGVETGLHWRPRPAITFTAAYTFSDSEFLEHFSLDGLSDFSGNQVPGVPEHTLYAAIQLDHASGAFASLEGRYVGAFYADDANQVRTDSYGVLDLRVGWRLERGRLRLVPQVGVNNMLDEPYIDYVRTGERATPASRIFEPAPGIEVYGGLSVAWTFEGGS